MTAATPAPSNNETRHAAGIGLASVVAEGPRAGTILDVWYPAPVLAQEPDRSLDGDLRRSALPDADRNVTVEVVDRVIDLDAAPVDAADVYLRLHLLSHRLVQPNTINLDGVFSLLANVAWTDRGPVLAEELNLARLRMRSTGHVSVLSVDKFPRMVDYVVPSGVRIGDADRVRLGAHLAEGTTVMHEGFVNFNAGTLGSAMVEGRISAGVVVGDHTDIGGGASIMGTLSGGGKQRIRLGQRVLPAWASPWAMTASSRPASTSPPERACRCSRTARRRPAPSRRSTCPGCRTCSSDATPPAAPSRPCRAGAARWS